MRGRRTGKLLNATLVVLIVVGIHAASADGVNAPDPRLDSIASSMAGKSVGVHCETDNETWDSMVQGVTLGARRGSSVGGYAYPGTTVLYLSPQKCIALRQSFNAGYLHAGLLPLSDGLMALLHEAEHLRGTVDEGETDCAALRAFRGYLDDVGVPATVVKPVKVAGRYILKRVVNSYFTRMVQLASIIHYSHPTPEYRRAC